MTGWWKGLLMLAALGFFTWALAGFLDGKNLRGPGERIPPLVWQPKGK